MPPFPKFDDGSSSTPPRPNASRTRFNFHSEFTANAPSEHRRQKQLAKAPRRSLVPLENPVADGSIYQIGPLRSSAVEVLVNDGNASTIAPVNVLSPPPLPLPVTQSKAKVIEPPNLHTRPSTPPRSLSPPNLTSFLSPSRVLSRPSKPVSSTHIARATDVLTDSGKAELLGLTLAQDGECATPMEKAVRRGLEVSPRKAGIGKEIRYTRGGLAERASQVTGRKTTSLSLWRKSPPSLQSAHMLVEIEEILSLPKPPPPRGGLAMSVCLARCRVSGEDTWMLVLLSVPPHDARRVPMAIMKAGCRVALWDPMVEVLVSRSRVYLCSRFVILS